MFIMTLTDYFKSIKDYHFINFNKFTSDFKAIIKLVNLRNTVEYCPFKQVEH